MKKLDQQFIDTLDAHLRYMGVRVSRTDRAWYKKALGKIADLVMWTTRAQIDQRERPKPRRDRHAIGLGD